MAKTVHIIETTTRDGQQSLWATRLTAAQQLPVMALLDRAGFHVIDCWGTAMIDVCVRYLRENPWDRLRLLREQVRQTPMQMIINVLGFSVGRGAAPDDVMDLLYTANAAAGIDQFFALDGLNDTRNFEVPLRAVKAAGKQMVASVVYSVSPVHTDTHFVEKTRDLVRQGVDVVVLKDPNGVLTPERVRTLVPAMIAAAGDVPVWCHSHCTTGLGPATNLEAIEYGARAIWTSSRPLANGSSLPATESMIRHLEHRGYDTGVDPSALEPIARHMQAIAERHGKPLGQPAEYDPFYYQHQLPGGMISNFRAQLAELGIGHRLDEVLEECPRVRADLGWPCMVTPYSQIVGTQAALNVLYGRYQVVINDVEKLVLGYYGRTPAPVDPNIVDRVGKGKEPMTGRPGSYVPPAVDRFRAENGLFKSDEDLLLHMLFMPDHVRQLLTAGPIPTEDRPPRSPLVDLVRSVAGSKGVTRFHLVQR